MNLNPNDPAPRNSRESDIALFLEHEKKTAKRPARNSSPSVRLMEVKDIDGLLAQLGTLFKKRLDIDDVMKVTDRWLKAYALKTKQDPDGAMGSKFGDA